jgi:hypothetical protein
MVKDFNYTSANGTHDRHVFVVNETATHISGYDLNLLNARSANSIVKNNASFVPTDSTSISDLPKHTASWDKAYRCFSKTKING